MHTCNPRTRDASAPGIASSRPTRSYVRTSTRHQGARCPHTWPRWSPGPHILGGTRTGQGGRQCAPEPPLTSTTIAAHRALPLCRRRSDLPSLRPRPLLARRGPELSRDPEPAVKHGAQAAGWSRSYFRVRSLARRPPPTPIRAPRVTARPPPRPGTRDPRRPGARRPAPSTGHPAPDPTRNGVLLFFQQHS